MLLFGILLFVSASSISAKTIHVGPTQSFHSIRSALAFSNNYDTIIVHHSQYKEGNIVVNKRIFMLGEGWPVLDGQHKYEVVSIKADSVVFSGFQIQNSGFASLNDPGASRYMMELVLSLKTIFWKTIFLVYTYNMENTVSSEITGLKHME